MRFCFGDSNKCGIVMALLSILLPSCSGGSSSPTPAPPADVELGVDLSSLGNKVPGLLYGINWHWENFADLGLITGERVADRSFRNMGTSAAAWTGGTGITFSAAGGDATPSGHAGYPGYALLDQAGTGQLFLMQKILGRVTAQSALTLRLSSNAESLATPTVFAALLRSDLTTVVAATQSDITTNGSWRRHTITLTPTIDADDTVLLLGIQGTGRVRLDEVRLIDAGATQATIDPALIAGISNLGIQSIRYPGGTLVDTFTWEDSVGTLLDRGEVPNGGGRYQTPSLGLDEFLRLCESVAVTPLLQVNVLESAGKLSGLVDYVNGSTTTAKGAERAANGHTAPYNVTYWELGNEPNAVYRGALPEASTGTNYAGLAATAATAMRARDSAIQLGGCVETALQRADWMTTSSPSTTVQMLANWNNQVVAASLVQNTNYLSGHFYSYFAHSTDPATHLRNLLSGGETLRNTRTTLDVLTGSAPLWLTEFHTNIEINGVTQAESLKDFQAGLSIADILMTLIADEYAAAHCFNLNQAIGFGLLKKPGTWDHRPSGLVFKELAAFAGETRVGTTASSFGNLITIPSGLGNIKSGTTYAALGIIATRQANGHARIALLNRSFGSDLSVRVKVTGGSHTMLELRRYESTVLDANNELVSDTVTVTSSTQAAGSEVLITVPAHSLVVMRYSK